LNGRIHLVVNPPFLFYIEIHSDLIERCKKNEREAQFELYKECYGMMMQICLRYLSNHDDAKALVNQAFLKVCDKIDTYKPEVAFQNWVKRITINTAIDDCRKSKNKKAQLLLLIK